MPIALSSKLRMTVHAAGYNADDEKHYCGAYTTAKECNRQSIFRWQSPGTVHSAG